jgi:hypothetical protein
MPGKRPWKVECVFYSPTSEVVEVVVHLFGCVGSNERTVGDLEVIGVLAVEAPKACPGGLVC